MPMGDAALNDFRINQKSPTHSWALIRFIFQIMLDFFPYLCDKTRFPSAQLSAY